MTDYRPAIVGIVLIAVAFGTALGIGMPAVLGQPISSGLFFLGLAVGVMFGLGVFLLAITKA